MVLLLRKRHLLTVVAAVALCGALLLTARPMGGGRFGQRFATAGGHLGCRPRRRGRRGGVGQRRGRKRPEFGHYPAPGGCADLLRL